MLANSISLLYIATHQQESGQPLLLIKMYKSGTYTICLSWTPMCITFRIVVSTTTISKNILSFYQMGILIGCLFQFHIKIILWKLLFGLWKLLTVNVEWKRFIIEQSLVAIGCHSPAGFTKHAPNPKPETRENYGITTLKRCSMCKIN